MSLQRSPPQGNSGSQPDLSKMREEAFTKHVSLKKRKNPECSCNFDEKLLDLQKKLMLSINATLETQNNNIKGTLNALRNDLGTFKEELQNMNEKIQNLESKQVALKDDIRDLKLSGTINNQKVDLINKESSEMQDEIKVLNEKLQAKEQQGRLNNLEISGVPVLKGENLFNIVNNIANKVGFNLASTDIDYIHRVRRFVSKNNSSEEDVIGQSPQNAPAIPNIIVRFTRRKRKNEMLAAVRARRVLNTTDAGLNGGSKPIFVNDHLTPSNKLLFRRARSLAKEKDYKYVWLSECKIFLRKSDVSKVILISNEKDLAKVQ